MKGLSAIARIFAVLTFVTVLSASVAFGQQVTGTILGRITDSTGSVVAGASIQIQNPETGFSRTDMADADGRYLESNLPLGTYTVTIQKAGFQTLVRSGVVLSVGSEATVNAELAVGDVQQHVEVTGEAPQIETTNAVVSGLVDPDQMRNLPLNGRSVDSLALLSPGIFANRASSGNTTVGVGLHITVNGARQDWNLYLLDGTVTNDALSGRSSAAGQALGVDGILEFRVLTHSFSAEYGRTAGGIISAVTRSGTNEFHGSAYEFLRNTIFNSQNVFASGAVPQYIRNQFGAAAGGPIFKNKLFFFANYEGLRGRQAVPVTSTVPDANAYLGILPCAIGSAGCSPAGTKTVPTNATIINNYLKPFYPACAGPSSHENGDGTCNVIQNFTEPSREDYTMMRLDYKISDKDSLFARYVYDPSIISTPQAVPIFVLDVFGNDHFLALGETHIFSPSTLNEFRFAFNRTMPGQRSYASISTDPSLDFVSGQVLGSFTFSNASGGSNALSTLGPNKSPQQRAHQNLFTETDTVTTVKGAHTIKFGVDVEREQINTSGCTNCAGAYQFSSLTNLLNATATNYTVGFVGINSGQASTPVRGWRRILFGSFVQDDYRIRPNLTLNLGLRWEFYTNPIEVSGYSSSYINVTATNNTPGSPFLVPKTNFAPRVGIAWDPTGSGKTSIRVGAGTYYNEITGRTWWQNAAVNADFFKTLQVANPVFPILNLNPASSTAPQQDQGVQYNSKEPVIYQWNLDVQRQLTSTLSLRAGYVGSHGVHLPGEAEPNIKTPTIAPDGTVSFVSGAPSVNPHFASMLTVFTNAVSDYNALQVFLQKTASRGLTFQASYTYGKALSNVDEITTGQILSSPTSYSNPYNPLADYSDSSFDQRHTLVANAAYQMPWDHLLKNGFERAILGGWSTNGIYSFGSGLPFTVLDGYNDSGSGDTNNTDRPNLNVGYSTNPSSGLTQGNTAGNPTCIANLGPKAGVALHTPNLWFDPCAFTPAPAQTALVHGTFGNLGRNTLVGPHLSTLDFTLVKTTPLTEKLKLEFRAECFNLFNHPNFGLPNGTISSKPGTGLQPTYNGNTGQITTTSVDNREMQFGLKLLF